MGHTNGIVLVLGSGPSVVRCRDWPRAPFDTLVAINNAWAVRPDWDMLITPEDFAPERMPVDVGPDQRLIAARDYVPRQNRYGGFVFAGGTMAFTAGYWALDALRPRVMAFLGCDMVYPKGRDTHFYGTGTADPLRDDPTLRDLGTKSARLAVLAAAQGCACVNLSDQGQSVLAFPRATPEDLAQVTPQVFDAARVADVQAQEAALGYETPNGRYWDRGQDYDEAALAGVDAQWLGIFSN